MEKVRIGPLISREVYERLVYLAEKRGKTFGTYIREFLTFLAEGREGDQIVRLGTDEYLRLIQAEGKIPPGFTL